MRKPKLTNRKSQAEVMGILMVIVLVSLGMLLVARFVVTKNASGEKQDFTSEQAVANTLNALLGITTDCNKLSVTELYQDCARGENIDCGSEKSCAHVRQIAKTVLDNTFGKNNLNKEYYYTVRDENGAAIPGITDITSLQYAARCKDNVISKTNPIPVPPNYIEIELSIC